MPLHFPLLALIFLDHRHLPPDISAHTSAASWLAPPAIPRHFLFIFLLIKKTIAFLLFGAEPKIIWSGELASLRPPVVCFDSSAPFKCHNTFAFRICLLNPLPACLVATLCPVYVLPVSSQRFPPPSRPWNLRNCLNRGCVICPSRSNRRARGGGSLVDHHRPRAETYIYILFKKKKKKERQPGDDAGIMWFSVTFLPAQNP
ncbi:uncharacterized protein BJ171DRAFT_150679 [Polychytrium aggregatum]|uniref:uncharacterized protein n=1 Tax=Polychytrium aggregatum TaxID=110093 RepID=UPI0022FDFBB5|nr:uncharacterized protein BJ171DRAFT_150679 [Polychytrium aggregatum]KAI9203373.1 hypothetical protein BJ171DRAFT_150679 [Polychytrium aggregatum]